MTFRTIAGAAAAAGLVLGAASAALGQTAGVYFGTTADGKSISMAVSGTAGNFSLTSLSLDFTADCARSGGSVDDNFGAPLDIPLTDGHADFSTEVFKSVYSFGSMHFVGNRTIKGTITTDQATFLSGTIPPNRTEFCQSPKQVFTMTLSAPENAKPLKPVAAVTRAEDAN